MRNDLGFKGGELVPARSVNSRSEPDTGEVHPRNLVSGEPTSGTIVVIEKRALLRECLTRCLEAALGPAVISFPCVENWIEVMDSWSACVIVLSVGGRSSDAESTQREINLLGRVANQRPIILLSDAEEPSQIVEALRSGTRGYIPTSVSLAIAIEAMRLVRAGGVYAPANCLMAANHGNARASKDLVSKPAAFSGRQSAVLNSLRLGKPNKIIAYELGMCESTVKVHVRNIMKKLKAKTRTEVAYLANEMNIQLANSRVTATYNV